MKSCDRLVLAASLCTLVACSGTATPADGSPGNDSGAVSEAGDVVTGSDATTRTDVASGVDATRNDAGNGATDAGGTMDSTSGSTDAGNGGSDSGFSNGGPGAPLVARGGTYMGSTERFNRFYTDPAYTPSGTIYVSPTGGGTGDSPQSPTTVADGMSRAAPGVKIVFLRGNYAGCYELTMDQSGTYDAPVVLYAERNADGSRGVRIDCCATGRQTCINLEAADYVAVDGFELAGGYYGVRSVGADYLAPMHQRGTAVIDCEGHDQYKDPFFSGQSDWAVWERNVAHHSGTGDGHGMYLSNGSDWNVVRFNETFDTSSADFQINADPQSTCADVGIAFDDPQCDGSARDGLGQGVSEFFTVEGNYFHHSNAQGPNFTSVRNSLVRNNVFGFATRHGTSFWQETSNPALGSSDNTVVHNLFIGSNARELLQFTNDSDRNVVENNVLVGVTFNGSTPSANSGTILINVDGTTNANVYTANEYIAGTLVGRSIESDEFSTASFDATWWSTFPGPAAVAGDINGLAPAASAPWLDRGALLPSAPIDRAGHARTAPTDLGPFER